jgi:ABC-type dipeptide/oligopeptide/nickel transport system permease subunit
VLILGFLFVGDGLRQHLDPENKVLSKGLLARR